MVLRITSDDQLEHLGKSARGQVEQELAGSTIKKPIERPEEEAGRKLVKWADATMIRCPWDPLQEICLGHYFAHVPNGGARTRIEGAILKGQGVRKGYPDYVVDLAMDRWHGMRLELKGPDGGKPDAEQLEVLARLEAAGYAVAVAWGYDDARNAITRYLGIRS